MTKIGDTLKGFAALAFVFGMQALGCLFQCAMLALAVWVGFLVIGFVLRLFGVHI